MKNLIFLAAIFLLTSSQLFAQTNDYKTSPQLEARCTELTRTMVNELRLNEIGYIKLKELNRDRIYRIEASKENYKSDMVALNLELQKIESDFEEKLVKILDASQLQAYTAYKRNNNANYIAVSGKN